jgi:hypothetical protein
MGNAWNADFSDDYKKEVSVKTSETEKYFRSLVLDDIDGSDNSALRDHCRDVTDHGCSSGCAGSVIYYSDTRRIFDGNKDGIVWHFCGEADELGEEGGAGALFSSLNGWDKSDPLALGDSNKNTLVWAMYEDTASGILSRIENGEDMYAVISAEQAKDRDGVKVGRKCGIGAAETKNVAREEPER